MNEYFRQFGSITYGDKSMIDITQRVAILNNVVNDRYSFYTYQIKNGMRAEQVAEKYYGDPNLVWLVYLCNNIVDPYYQWPMSDDMLNTYIIKKYGSVEKASTTTAYYRINWYDDQSTLTLGQYSALPSYEKKYWEPELDQFNYPSVYTRKQIDYKTSSLTVSAEEAKYWSAVSQYDDEAEKNANKANIRLLDSRLSDEAISNLRELLGQ